MNEWVGHPVITDCCFESKIINIGNLWYIQEDYQDGEIYSEDEIYGSNLYDLENKRKIEVSKFILNKEDWNWYLENKKWEEMSYEFAYPQFYGEAIKFYQNEIKKRKEND